MKTIYDIKTDIYKYLKGSKLAKAVDGELVKGTRTKSGKEDIVIHTPAEAPFAELQDIVVYVNIYTQDTQKGADFVENDPRIKALSKVGYEVLKKAKGDTFSFWCSAQQIFSVEATHEHAISFKLLYRNYEENY